MQRSSVSLCLRRGGCLHGYTPSIINGTSDAPWSGSCRLSVTTRRQRDHAVALFSVSLFLPFFFAGNSHGTTSGHGDDRRAVYNQIIDGERVDRPFSCSRPFFRGSRNISRMKLETSTVMRDLERATHTRQAVEDDREREDNTFRVITH